MVAKKSDRKKYEKWEVDQIRLTYFSKQITEAGVSTWWQHTVGSPSEQKTINQKQNIYQEQGSLLNSKLMLSTNFDRIDWLYFYEENESGPFIDSLESFTSLMIKWFEMSPSLNRLALGLCFRVPVKNKKDGYKFIAKLLPSVEIDVDNSSDFLYQINRPRKTTTDVADLKINRLMKWSVAVYKRFSVSPQKVEFADSEKYFVKLDLDINTGAEYNQIIPSDKIGMIYSELISLAKEILVNGDVQ